jgi:PD-(D/E)XK endonuclease
LLYPLSYGGQCHTTLLASGSVARHHTKDKGDLGVAKVHADLASKGFTVLFPATEHAPFDLVAYADGEFHRLQVKYRSARSGAVIVKFSSMWADRNGTHTAPMDKSAIDAVCIYCPETDQCYYIRPSAHGTSITLRIAPSRNGQHVGVLEAEAFREMPHRSD